VRVSGHNVLCEQISEADLCFWAIQNKLNCQTSDSRTAVRIPSRSWNSGPLYPRKNTGGVLGVCPTGHHVPCGLGESFGPGPSGVLWGVLRGYGVLDSLLRAIRSLYPAVRAVLVSSALSQTRSRWCRPHQGRPVRVRWSGRPTGESAAGVILSFWPVDIWILKVAVTRGQS